MPELSLSNIEFLKEEISKSGITYSHLLDDLIDHVCCDVEQEMLQGLPFDKAFERVKRKIGSGGLQRIQENTMLLIDKNYRIMKTLMKISGVIAPVLIALGTIFRIEYWPFAGILIVAGFVLMGFLFLPSVVYVTYKEINNRSKKLAHITGFIAAFLVLFGFIARVMHWPGTGVIMLAGMLCSAFLFLPTLLYFKLKDKTSKKPKQIYIIGTIGMLIYCLGFTFKIFHWPGATMLLAAGSLLLVFIAIPWYLFLEYKHKTAVSNSFIFILFIGIWVLLPTMLIALNVPDNIWEPFFEIQRASDINIRHFKEKNQQYISLLTGLENQQAAMKAETAQRQSEQIIALIDSVGSELLSVTENDAGSWRDRSTGISGLKTLKDIGEITKSSQYMAGDQGRGFDLAQRLAQYGEAMKQLADNDAEISSLTDQAFKALSENPQWVKENFDQMPLINSLNLLNLLKERVYMIQGAVLHKICNDNQTEGAVDINLNS